MTATPINNSLMDFYNPVNFFARNDVRHFSAVGIQNPRLHFMKLACAVSNLQSDQMEALLG